MTPGPTPKGTNTRYSEKKNIKKRNKTINIKTKTNKKFSNHYDCCSGSDENVNWRSSF